LLCDAAFIEGYLYQMMSISPKQLTYSGSDQIGFKPRDHLLQAQVYDSGVNFSSWKIFPYTFALELIASLWKVNLIYWAAFIFCSVITQYA
jgi:hypothetical protein